MKYNSLTYQKSGVNIKAADKFIDYISYKLRKSKKKSNFKNIGGFGAINKIPVKRGIPYLVTSTDGVGTKLELANDLKKFDTKQFLPIYLIQNSLLKMVKILNL